MPRAPSIPHDSLTEEVKGRYGTLRFFTKDTVIGAALRAYGEWAENELRFLGHVIPSGGTVIDVGAFVGTHALAFAHRVGEEGQVHAFEPQSRSFALLETNIRANGLNRVHLHHAAVGAAPGQACLDVMKTDEAANFAGLGVRSAQSDAGTFDEVAVVAIDSLDLRRCDLIKLDVEGAEDAVLRGAVGTITRLKPVIYAECNSLADGARSFAELTSLGYALFVHIADAFNPDNWFGARENMFGVAREAAIVGVPPERRDEIAALTDPNWQIFELNSLDDLAYALLQKPQYIDEILRAGVAARCGGRVASGFEYAALEQAHHRVVEAQHRLAHECEAQRRELADLRQVVAATERSNIFKIVRPIIRAEVSFRTGLRKLRLKMRAGLPKRRPVAARRTDDSRAELTIRLQGLTERGVAQTIARKAPLMVCVSHVSPCPPRAGNEYRILQLTRWLRARGLDLLLIVCPLPGEELAPERAVALAAEFDNVVVVGREGELRVQLARQDLAEVLGSLSGVDVRNFAEALREDANSDGRILSITRTFCPDLLLEVMCAIDAAAKPFAFLLSYCFMTRGVPLLRPDVTKIVDTIDVFSTKASKVVRFGIEDTLALTPAEERDLLSGVDAVLAIQPDEADELRALGLDAPVLTVGVDMDVSPPAAGQPAEPVVLMVASDNEMNVKGLRDFLRFAWPRVRAAVPAARFHVVGSVGRILTGHEPNVRWLGHLDDLGDAYAAARLVINPVVAGTGVKIKTLEALSQLRPIVLWPSGVDGLSPELRTYCVCVTDWYAFGESVIVLLRDAAAGVRLIEARDTISALLSPEHVYAEFQALLSRRLSVGEVGHAPRAA